MTAPEPEEEPLHPAIPLEGMGRVVCDLTLDAQELACRDDD